MANNRIQIKRSTANSVVSGLNPGELAFTANGNILYIGNPADGASVRIAGIQNPGTLTANQALVANTTSAINKIIVGELEFTGSAQKITANNGVGSAGEVLVSGGAGNTYWSPVSSLSGSVNTNFAYTWNNTHTFALGINIGNSTILTVTNTAITYVGNTTTLPTVSIANTGAINIGNSSTTQTASQLSLANSVGNSVLTPTTLKVGSALNVNATQIVVSNTTAINANGGIGTAGQVLYSNGSTVYWSSPTVGDITSVNAGNGLVSGGTAGDVTLDVGAGNGISVSADAVAVSTGTNGGLVANTSGLFILAGDGLLSNASGLHVGSANGISISADAVGVLAGDGLIANVTGVHVVAGNGMFVDADSIRVLAGNSQLISNTTGVWVNQAQIDHNSLTNYSVNRHIDHSAVNISTGNGLSGGGDITTSRTLTVTGANGISVTAAGVNVLANNGIVSNATGVYVNGGSTLTVNSSGAHVNTILSITDLSLSGNLTVLGTLSTIDTTNLTVRDSIIELANGNSTTDLLDIGLYGQYGASGSKYTGFYRDASDGEYKLFTGSQTEPTTTVDTGAAGYTQAILNAFLKSGALVSNGTNLNVTANSTLAVAIVANTLTLSTALAGTSGGTGKATVANNSLLVGNSSNGYAELTLNTNVGYVLQSNGTALVYDYLDGGTF